MRILRLQIEHLRILQSVELEPGPDVNFILGANGAGKTSLLEGIYLLGQGKSFRHTEAGPMISTGATSLRVVAWLESPRGTQVRLGVERSGHHFRARLNGRDVARRSDLVKTLPVQLFTPRSHELVERGPDLRRQFLDQGLFHVEHDYHPLMMEYNRALRQRNAALKSGDATTAQSFEPILSESGEAISTLRTRIVELLSAEMPPLLKSLGIKEEVELRLLPGWKGNGLAEALASSRERDLKRGFTSPGPHRGELKLRVEGVPVVKRLSRGQQKLLVYALGLANVAIQVRCGGVRPVLLADDLPSELDPQRTRWLLNVLAHSGCQVLVTALEGSPLPEGAGFMFHVEQGRVEPMRG